MPNMAVAYRGPDPSLIQLTNELRAHYGSPARTYEFVTGYKSAANYSGHNPDSSGIVHAVDIFTDDHGNIPQIEGRALAERLRLIGKRTGRFSYLIHDMSAGAPQPMIAGKHTNWEWVPYTGADAHSDHIHVSIADGYWGDPCNVPATITNDTSSWGIAALTGQSSGTTPIMEEGFLMSLPEADQVEVVKNVRKLVYGQQSQDKVVAALTTQVGQLSTQLEEVVGNARKAVYGIQDVKAGLAALPAKDIAAAIPDNLAQQVVDALAERLGK